MSSTISASTISASTIPSIIFIVPYRNRIQHKLFFSKYMTSIMKDYDDKYEIYFSCTRAGYGNG